MQQARDGGREHDFSLQGIMLSMLTAPLHGPPKRSICVFCGSKLGHHHEWASTAADVGRMIAERGWGLVFGAGRWGLMGTVAQAVIEENGWVTGIIPRYLMQTEPVIPGLSDLQVVETMVERKVRMIDQSDAFLVLPGGIGTFEELFEVWTGRQTGAHTKPIVVCNLNGYFDALFAFVHQAKDHGFLGDGAMDKVTLLHSTETVFAELDRMLGSEHPKPHGQR